MVQGKAKLSQGGSQGEAQERFLVDEILPAVPRFIDTLEAHPPEAPYPSDRRMLITAGPCVSQSPYPQRGRSGNGGGRVLNFPRHPLELVLPPSVRRPSLSPQVGFPPATSRSGSRNGCCFSNLGRGPQP